MPRIDLPTGLEGSENLPLTRKELRNCFNTGEGIILPRPGITQLNTTSFAARGSFKWNGALYMVFGNDLVKITNLATGTNSTIGTIAGSADIATAVGFNHAVIVVKGGSLYTLSKTDVLTDISANANIEPSVAVTHINGRFVYIPSSGDPAFFSDVGAAGTVQAESFFDAEQLPDLNSTCFNFGNTLYIGGTDSFELFRDVGASPVPFVRIEGASLRYGFIGALQEHTDTFLFLGREKDQDYGFYAIAPGRAIKISNSKIDEILAGYSLMELANCVPGRLKWRGYDIATFTLARDSFGFMGGRWFTLDTVVDGISRPWNGGFITELDGKYYTASGKKIGRFDNVNTDFGERITRIIDIAFRHPENRRFSVQSVEIGISQGFNGSVGSVALMMSRNNVNYGPALFRQLGAQGKYADKLTWNIPGGLGNYNGFAGLRIYTTQDVSFAADSLFMNIR